MCSSVTCNSHIMFFLLFFFYLSMMMHIENESVSHSVVSDFLQPYGL